MEQIIEQVRQITPELIEQTIEYSKNIIQFWSIFGVSGFLISIVVGIIGIKKEWGGDSALGVVIMVFGGLASFILMSAMLTNLYKLNTAPYLFVFDSLTR